MYGYSDPIEDFFLFIAVIGAIVFFMFAFYTIAMSGENSAKAVEREAKAKTECLTDGNDWFTSVNGRESGCIESAK